MANGTKKRERIWVTDEITRQLTKEFETSGVTVLNALKFHSFSEQAGSIRNRAIELMKEVTTRNEQLIAELDS